MLYGTVRPTMVQQNIIAILVLCIFAAGAIAGPSHVDRLRAERRSVHKSEEGLRNRQSTCISQEELSVLYQRIANLEKRQDETRKEVDELAQQTDQMLNKPQEENSEVLNTLTERYEETNKAIITQNADVLRYLNKPLNVYSGICRSGFFGTEYYDGIENTWPRTYAAFFDPPFSEPPSFTYGIEYLDSPYVRVNTSIIELGGAHAKIKVSTWSAKDLYGVRYRWMACP